MILLDTHIWIWWVHGDANLRADAAALIQTHQATGLGVSAISCWEVAKLVELGRLSIPTSIDRWMQLALAYPGVQLIPLTPEISIESTRLPGSFHRDPADQILVGTARVLGCQLITMDARLRAYPHVTTAP